MNEKNRTLALNSLKQGNFVQAKALLAELLKQGDHSLKSSYDFAKEELLRRYWRQGKVQELIQESEGASFLALAIARLSGKEALQTFIDSSHPDVFLAKLSLEPSLKIALLQMRQVSHWKEMAEGWLSLMKKDLGKARASFEASAWGQRKAVAISLVDALERSIRHTEFLKFAMHRFPHFAKMMGRSKESSTVSSFSKEFIYSQLRLGSFEDLEKLVTQLTPSQREEKGWVYLRLGDLYYGKEKKLAKALSYWKKAESFHPILRLDILKREFALSYQEGEWDACKEMFLEYFYALNRKDKNLAHSFCRNLLRTTSSEFYMELPVPYLSVVQEKWLTSEVPDVVRLFAGVSACSKLPDLLMLKLSHRNTSERRFFEMIYEQFQKAESVFGEDDLYLDTKIHLTLLLGHQKERRKALARFMEIHPSSFETKIPQYVQAAFLAKEEETVFKEEIKRLSFLFPAQFDLARLQYLVDSPISRYSDSFSPALQSVLELQMRLDKGEKKLSAFFEKACSFFGKDQEADWRLWYAIATSKSSSISFANIKKSFNKTVLKEKLGEKIFQQILKYQEVGLSEELVDYWISKDSKAWLPFFARAINAAEQMDWTEALRFLYEATFLIPKGHPFVARITMLENFLKLMRPQWIDIFR